LPGHCLKGKKRTFGNSTWGGVKNGTDTLRFLATSLDVSSLANIFLADFILLPVILRYAHPCGQGYEQFLTLRGVRSYATKELDEHGTFSKMEHIGTSYNCICSNVTQSLNIAFE
jgi:hypothetical protein